MIRAFFILGATLSLAHSALTAPIARAQDSPAEIPAIIDTIIVRIGNVFTPEETESNQAFDIANKIRLTTRSYVVTKEFLFEVGQPYSELRIAETARNLRKLGLFREVSIDSQTIDGKLAVIVRTQDGWSTKPTFGIRSSAGTVTLAAGLTEANFLGTGNRASVIFRKEIDRNSVNFDLWIKYLPLFDLTLGGGYQALSDGTSGNWQIGSPFRSHLDGGGVMYTGYYADRRVLQYRTEGPAFSDTTEYRRSALIHVLNGGLAKVATSRHYFRVGIRWKLSDQGYVRGDSVGLLAPDSLSSEVGLWIENKISEFEEIRYYNGFGQAEDLDLSTTLKIFADLTPDAWGFSEDGVNVGSSFSWGYLTERGYLRGRVSGNLRLTRAEADSGRVEARISGGLRTAKRQALFFLAEGGVRRRTPPGGEFTLGYARGPRSYGPHAFVGTRAVWGTLEYRWYLWDDFLELIGLGFAAFADYGGAWYVDQDPRFGLDVGVGLRVGSIRGTSVKMGTIDLGYRFADGYEGDRFAVSFGPAIVF